MPRILIFLAYFFSSVAVSGTAVFIMPFTSDFTSVVPFALPFLGMTVLYFVVAPHPALWWALFTGLCIDIFTVPHNAFTVLILSALWLTLRGSAHMSRSLPYRVQVCASILGASTVAYVAIAVQAFWHGWFVLSWDSIRRICIAIVLHTGVSVGVIGIFFLIRRFSHAHRHINRTHAPSSK